MSQALFALERRFERRALYVLQYALIGALIFGIWNLDWWLVGICLLGFFLNGLIGKGLQKNAHKSFSQLAAGSRAETEIVLDEPSFEDFRRLSRSTTKFSYLVVLITAAIAWHFGMPWWAVIGFATTGWALSIALPMLAFYKAKP
jgi:hypothetical protein